MSFDSINPFSRPKAPPAIIRPAQPVPTQEDPAVAQARLQALRSAASANRRAAIATSSRGVVNPVAPVVTRLSGVAA